MRMQQASKLQASMDDGSLSLLFPSDDFIYLVFFSRFLSPLKFMCFVFFMIITIIIHTFN